MKFEPCKGGCGNQIRQRVRTGFTGMCVACNAKTRQRSGPPPGQPGNCIMCGRSPIRQKYCSEECHLQAKKERSKIYYARSCAAPVTVWDNDVERSKCIRKEPFGEKQCAKYDTCLDNEFKKKCTGYQEPPPRPTPTLQSSMGFVAGVVV